MRQTLILAKSTTEANRYAKLFGMDRFTYRAVTRAGAIRGLRSAEVHILPSFLQRVDRHSIVAELRMARRLDVIYVDPVDLVLERLQAGEPGHRSWQEAGWTQAAADRMLEEPRRWLTGLDAAEEECTPTCAPHLHQFCSPRCEEAARVENDEPDNSDAKFGEFEPIDVEPFEKVLDEYVEEVADEMPQNDDITDMSQDDDPEPVGEDVNAKKRRRKRCFVCDQLVWSADDPAHDADAHATDEALKTPAPKPTVSDFFG